MEAIHRAFASRGALANARLRVLEARRNRDAAGAYPATRLDLGRGTPVDIGGSADLLLYQPLDVFGKSRAAARQADALVATAVAAFRQRGLDIQQEALTAYANLASAQRLLAVAQTQRDLAAQVREATAKRVAARDLAEIQSLRADVELAKADQLVTDRQAAIEAARLRLAAALGTDDAPSDSTLPPLEPPPPPTQDLSLTRPELQSLRADQAAAEADARAARLSAYPDVEIQAGRAGFDNPEEYGARLQLSFNLWDHGAARNLVRAADARKKAAQASYDDRLKAARKDVEAAQIELNAAQKSVQAYEKLAVSARDLLNRTQVGFELGASTLIEVIDARRTLTDGQELVVNAQLRRDLAVEGLLRAQGRFLEEPK